MVDCPLVELPGGARDLGVDAFIAAEQQVERPVEDEGGLFHNVGDWRIRGQPQRLLGGDEAHVIAAAGDLGRRGAVVEARLQPDADAWAAGDRNEPADNQGRPENALVIVETRRKIDDLQRVTLIVAKGCRDDGRVLDIGRLRARQTLEVDGERTALAPRSGHPAAAVNESAKRGIAVDPRKASPHDTRLAIDERSDAAVADDAEVQRSQSPVTRQFRTPG